MGDPLFLLIILAVAAVVVVLVIGIGGFGKGGEFNRKYGNKLMRLRILAQFIAVALVVLYVWLRGSGG
ncbi:twin transmembrane helix small protein [Sedimentitalea nanhaiensis]|uniref:Hypoxia induced protein conserved region n=1 Tax=Sedimentitalea nanhaiensis TaxID=999627 RepID=A0A1I7BLX8_9RHOB|nr:twin transmembrane helix small protein [Sedimentitalea nanhaiensis]SFT88091.1 Hypoxia induced protein conserved region [Sedimentitalea nanhaiensis]